MASHSKTNYAMSMVGKNVTASRFTVSGDLDTTTGMVEKVSLVDNEYIMYIGDKKYTSEQIMSVGMAESVAVDPTKYDMEMRDITSDSAVLQWKVPTENAEKAKELTYTVYYSTDEDFDSVAQVEAGTKVGKGEEKNITHMTIKDLDPATTYYANVVVSDPSGNKSVYKPKKFITLM